MPPRAVDDMERTPQETDVKFYRPGYKEKNWAPESIPIDDIKALVQASQFAVNQGVVSPNVAEMLLPIRLKEGRGDFGNNSNAYHNSPKTREAVAKLFGIVQQEMPTMEHNQDLRSPVMKADQVVGFTPQFEKKVKKGDFIVAGQGKEFTPQQYALLSLLKLSTTGEQDPKKAVEKYNGAGKAARVYSDLVESYKAALDTPENAPLKKLIQDLTSKQRSKK